MTRAIGEQSRWQHNWRWPALGLLALTFLAYLPSLWAGYIWDDPDYILHNYTLRSLGGLVRMWTVPTSLPQWYPMVHATFWVEFHLWGLNPVGYHVDNVLLQAISAILLWKVLLKLEVPGAWLAAAIFAVHPVHVESVAWVTERKNTLSTVFYLFSALAYWRCFPANQEEDDSPQRHRQRRDQPDARASLGDLRVSAVNSFWWWYFASIAFFLAAMLSKTVACTLPAALLLMVYWRRGRIRWADVWPTIPMFVIGIGLGVVTVILERSHVGASGNEWNLTGLDRLIIAGRALWFYAGKLAVPWPLAFMYPRWQLHSWEIAFPIVAILAMLALWLLRSRIGRGPLVAVLFFAGTLFPALGFFNIFPMRYSFVADHFQHQASIGLTTLLAVAIVRLGNVWQPTVSAILLLICITLSILQCRIYADSETLWRDAMAKTPGSWMVYTNLGRTLEAEGRPMEGIPYHERALAIQSGVAETHQNVAEGRLMQGRLDDAERDFDAALAIDPKYAAAYIGLAKLEYFQRHDPTKADGYLQKALQLQPDDPSANFAYGELLESRGDLAGAADRYQRSVNTRPDDFDAEYNLGTALIHLHRPADAISPLQAAVAIDPNNSNARINLRAAMQMSGRITLE